MLPPLLDCAANSVGMYHFGPPQPRFAAADADAGDGSRRGLKLLLISLTPAFKFSIMIFIQKMYRVNMGRV